MLQSMRQQRVRHNWVTEQQQVYYIVEVMNLDEYIFNQLRIRKLKNLSSFTPQQMLLFFYRDLPFWPKLFCFSLKKLRENSKFFLEIQKHFFSPTNSLNFCLRKYLSLHHLCMIISLDTKLGFLDFRIFFFLDLDFRLFKAGF